MQILRYFLTVGVLGEHDTQEIQQEIIDLLKALMPNANGNELRIHLCPQETYDEGLRNQWEAERKAFNQGKPGASGNKATKPAAGAAPGSKASAKTGDKKAGGKSGSGKAPAAAAGKQATKAKHLTTGQANHDGSGGNQE